MATTDICEQCEVNPLPNGRFYSQQHQGLRVCSACYYACVDVTCKQIGKVLGAMRYEIQFYEQTCPELYRDHIAKVRAEQRAQSEQEAEARRRQFWPGPIRAGYD